MYADLNPKKGAIVLIQPAFFFIRRFTFGIAVCLVNQHLIWQFALTVAQSLVQISIIGNKVYTNTSKARFEYANEVMLMLVMYTVLCFSPFVEDVNAKLYAAYVSIFVVALHLAFNLGLILWGSITDCKLDCRKRFVMKR